jgi:hypothetical protein
MWYPQAKEDTFPWRLHATSGHMVLEWECIQSLHSGHQWPPWQSDKQSAGDTDDCRGSKETVLDRHWCPSRQKKCTTCHRHQKTLFQTHIQCHEIIYSVTNRYLSSGCGKSTGGDKRGQVNTPTKATLLVRASTQPDK